MKKNDFMQDNYAGKYEKKMKALSISDKCSFDIVYLNDQKTKNYRLYSTQTRLSNSDVQGIHYPHKVEHIY
ncbi:hypothetical protein [Dysgonomonas sp. 520]|uniref:hypothetical protein n=1 Tax=Dysgonomonas sp. 520 TaxID=2302931 RepID=UPI0013D623F0|nr:hypothetical protein [Dysgonomonas sp. 520]NDW10076.1 hypothetical protein [Dysgonomonas sp. 520]